ncbi:MAG: hypothetical protein ACK5MH_06010 [Bacteroidales bacterium]|nr:hypothetical protein [Bacteroidales bacterium]MDD4684689.1 hypothetical protein [Bacteroidales bacterium]MDD4684740.1 hypothetical protein [Bacteroidales bacterium]
MELTWSERYLIIALRILKPLFGKYGYTLREMQYGSRDGDYLIFEEWYGDGVSIKIVYNPGFDIIISKKKLFRTKEYSLIKLKNNYPSYSNLPDNYHGEDGLKEILEGYRDFLKYIISNKKLLH